ncbi:efflux transporter outer membrane subunit [Sphingomonas immobilis]|uniref:Efflux transporter outer membrane subunit n=1 Tax=Sphingomonas immobilis TaxID=3063997 RepID=A0ABT8ZUF4_9SPHN|nr:efflux transporter outer membrane subunit [Sphingomonas sp. CA1-15]MDO7841201.1 efflux transporter outer membrane subunit [Sphingomonas sp. CA1-15]
MIRKYTLVALAAAAAVGGCTVGPNYKPPEMAVPPAFAEKQGPGSSVDPAHWWTAFGDPQLDALVARALKDSPNMAIAASRVKQARLGEIQARGVGLPTVGSSANASHIELSKNAGLSQIAQLFSGGGSGSGSGSTGGIALPGTGITTYSVGFDASWEIDLFGGGRRQVEGAVARTDAAIWNQRDAGVTLAAEVAQAYFALRLDQAQIAIVEDEIVHEKRTLAIAGHTAKAGLSPQIDVTRQRGTLTSLEARLEPLRADVRVRVHALGVLVGDTPEALDEELAKSAAVPLGLPDVPAGLPSDLLRRRPDIRAAERQLAAATADIGVAVSDLYPKFKLTGAASLLSTSLSNLFSRDSVQGNVSGGATFPILDWGRRKATVGLRKEDREQAYAQYRATVLGALRDVEDPLARLDAERRRNATLKRALADAQATVHAVEAQYRTGFVAQNTLLDAQVQALSAREQLAASDSQLRQDTASLFKAIGGGWEEGSPAAP